MIKILSIGNGAAQDAQRNLSTFAACAGYDLMTRTAWIEDCSLEAHWDNFKTERACYTWEENGTKIADGYTLTQALMAENWSIITLEQTPELAGLAESYEPYLSNLLTAIGAMCPDARIFLNETYAPLGEDGACARIRAVCRAAEKEQAVTVIPTAEAVCAAGALADFDPARGGVSLYGERCRLNTVLGQYLLAALWYKVLLGRTPVGNRFLREDESIPSEALVRLQKIGAAYYGD